MINVDQLNKMEKLEIYNIGKLDREVYRATIDWRRENIEHLKSLGLIVETGDMRKAYKLTQGGEDVYRAILWDANLTIAQFRSFPHE